ncbi:MAG: SoxR reducing system RseC family protein [Rhodocyclaceae bacterium]
MRVEATVLHIRDGQATVEVARPRGGCGRCDEPGGCRGASLVDASSRCGQYTVANVLDAAPGARVALDVPAGAPLRAALLAYVFPLIALLAGAGLGQALVGSDLGAAAGAGLALAFAVAVLRHRRHMRGVMALQPRMIRIVAEQ